MQTMYHPPSDLVINSMSKVNRENITKLKRHLRECIGMEEMLISCIFIKKSSFVSLHNIMIFTLLLSGDQPTRPRKRSRAGTILESSAAVVADITTPLSEER